MPTHQHKSQPKKKKLCFDGAIKYKNPSEINLFYRWLIVHHLCLHIQQRQHCSFKPRKPKQIHLIPVYSVSSTLGTSGDEEHCCSCRRYTYSTRVTDFSKKIIPSIYWTANKNTNTTVMFYFVVELRKQPKILLFSSQNHLELICEQKNNISEIIKRRKLNWFSISDEQNDDSLYGPFILIT